MLTTYMVIARSCCRLRDSAVHGAPPRRQAGQGRAEGAGTKGGGAASQGDHCLKCACLAACPPAAPIIAARPARFQVPSSDAADGTNKQSACLPAWGASIARQCFNMRLAPEEVSDQLSGFKHNAVTPVAMATRIPIIVSHLIPKLEPDCFFLGAGEVDLKLGLCASEFVARYRDTPLFVADCTYGSAEDEKE